MKFLQGLVGLDYEELARVLTTNTTFTGTEKITRNYKRVQCEGRYNIHSTSHTILYITMHVVFLKYLYLIFLKT